MEPNPHPNLPSSAWKTRTPLRGIAVGGILVLFLAWMAFAATTVPTDIQMPGTQPAGVDNPPAITSSGNCGCHDFTDAVNPHPENAPLFGWAGGMMANAGRDPLFWATVAVAEEDFLPGSGGVGDLCIKCHSTKGWIEGRSTPTNGSGLNPTTDSEGIMCDFCHLVVNPDADNTMPPVRDPRAGYIEEQHAPFLAYDETTGEGYYGGAEYVLNAADSRLGPFAADAAKHAWIQSSYHRDARMCGTCHDVSNPAVGDLAHNHGTQAPFTGPFNGTPNGTLTEKAALNNPPHTFGIVERTFTEWTASGLDTLAVNDFPSLPADLRVPGGSLEKAYEASRRGFCSATATRACNLDQNCPAGETCVATTANFEDGSTRYFTCQTCHMAASGGKAAQQGMYRTDLPRHDQTGGSYWIQDAIQYQDANGTLRFGTGLTSAQIAALAAGKTRAEGILRSAATVSAAQVGTDLKVRVTNLTGHKLISGYPEGRRMWLNIEWYDAGDNLLYANGAYGPIGNVVTDRDGTPFDVRSILDLSSTRIYEAKPAMTREWAQQLRSLGYPGTMALDYDRGTNAPVWTLQDLADDPPASLHPTFHFVLNNAVYKDTRIPPYGMQYDVALARNALPVPDSQFGDPGPGGAFQYWDETRFPIPAGAVRAEVKLLYQSTSWEYIQFLWLANSGGDPFLGAEGVNLLDAWLNTGMSAPFEMTSLSKTGLVPPAHNPPGGASGPAQAQMVVTGYDPATGAIALAYDPACDATGHTIHYGPLAAVGTYGWAGADCTLDASGTATFVPNPAVGESLFWVIVGSNPDFEGSYGTGAGGERPANSAAAGACYRPRTLATFCE